MYLGLVDGKISKALPGARGICPACHDEIIAKCGDIKIWHWAHKVSEDCLGDGSEPETDWHRDWKNIVPINWCERLVKVGNQIKRADIIKLTVYPVVYEFQHSYISPEEIMARQIFYLKEAKCGMVWVFDVQEGTSWQSGDKQGDERLHIQPRQARPGDDVRFYWENGRTSILSATTQLYLDLGNYYIGLRPMPRLMIQVYNFSKSGKFGGHGRLLTKQMFLEDELLFYLPGGSKERSPAYDHIVEFEYN